MDPPSPTKFPMSPGMPLFPVSPERAAGTKPLYGATPESPSMAELRTSPLRGGHRRNDSDVSGLASMFENLAVKDPKEAQQKWMQTMQKQKTKHMGEIQELERKQKLALERYEVRFDELKNELKKAQRMIEQSVAKEDWDRQRQEHRAAIGKWEEAMKKTEEAYKQAQRKAHEYGAENNTLKSKCMQYKKKGMEFHKESLRISGQIPTLQAEVQSLKHKQARFESQANFDAAEAQKYKHQVYGLQVDLESLQARSDEEIQTLKDKLRLVEGERDALKTSLKEEEVLRIAAEGQIPLPAATTDERDDFGSPVRSPRKRTPERDEEDKENVAPRKTAVELKFLNHELAAEKRLRQRAQDQVEFMKMECQFRICSCRIADMRDCDYVHDNSHAAEMARIRATVPEMTPPSSNHEDDPMEDIVIKTEPLDDEMRPFTPPADIEPTEQAIQQSIEQSPEEQAQSEEPEPEPEEQISEPVAQDADADVAFSPTTGTFKPVASPVKAPVATYATPAKASRLGLSAITERTRESSPWTPDANSTVIQQDAEPSHLSVAETAETSVSEEAPVPSRHESKLQSIVIHEDAVADSDEEDEPQTPLHGPSGPATPGQYLTRTITTTTTIPLHFSPMTPAVKGPNQAMTPSTIAHAPTNAQSQVLGELSLNKLPFDREAALEAIRQRRGRARSMAAGHGTPHKQMMEGVGARRDISAPVARVGR